MSAYIAVYQTPDEDSLPRLVALAEEWLHQPTSSGACIHNVAMVPRSRQLYLYIEAPTATLGAHVLAEDGLMPISIDEAGFVEWGRLVSREAAGCRRRDPAGATFLAALLAV